MNTNRSILRGGKPFIAWAVIGASLLTGFLCGAAAQTTVTRQLYRIYAFGCNATYADASTAIPNAVTCQAVFKRNITNPNDSTDFEESGKSLSVSFNLLANPTNTLTVNPGAQNGGSVTITDAQGALWLRKRSEQAAGL